jgi:hypothetical protein
VRPSAGLHTDRPDGHHKYNSYREDGYGSLPTLTHLPVKGTLPDSSHLIAQSHSQQLRSYARGGSTDSNRSNSHGKLPKLNFPVFDGESPKFWISRCEDYFEMYDVPPVDWIKVSSMHFIDPAAKWLQFVARRVKSCSWVEFCSLVLDRFRRDHHELLFRQFLHVKQSGSVLDYIDQFSSLVDQLNAYEESNDPLHYTMRFIDGLKPEFKSVVLMQRPSSLDTAFVLACLQEEVAPPFKRKDYSRPDYGFHQRSTYQAPLQLPAPPSKSNRPVVAEDRRTIEVARAKPTEDRWRALRAYRRAKGLCQYCAEKWSKDHKCSDTIQLHALQEVMELFQIEEDKLFVADTDYQAEDQLFLTLSLAAVSGVSSHKTMCLEGLIQGHHIKILVDSGSSNTFISDQLAAKLSGVILAPQPVMVQVANGHNLQCVSILPDAEWFSANLSFRSDLKVLPLSSYDMILGLDWLELYSLMKIHWKHKWISLPYQGSTVVLHGSTLAIPEGTVLQVCSVQITSEQLTYQWKSGS